MSELAIKMISAGAGSGKTYRLAEELVQLLQGDVRPNGIIATTFTKKAAAELQERVRIKLLEKGFTEKADALTNALIGTVHSLGVKLLRRFAFEAGVSPEVSIIAEEDQQVIFNNAISMVLQPDQIRRMEEVSRRLGLLASDETYDFRKDLKRITDIARTNDLGYEVLEQSKQKSIDSFLRFFMPLASIREEAFDEAFRQKIKETIDDLQQSDDQTKTTRLFVEDLRRLLNRMRIQAKRPWHEWVKVGKGKVAKASRPLIEGFQEFVQSHESHPRFQRDIRTFIEGVFDGAIAALREYAEYKKNRGLIDYIDMEILVKNLLDHPRVQTVLQEELDLLLVDEFQDTSPIQLELFLKLSQMARYSIWVGDPKQSIYGFRGAAPELMRAVIEQTGGIRPENIQRFSWRSRSELVFAANALFTRAFSDVPPDQVALEPKRKPQAGPQTANTADEPASVRGALHHWHFEPDTERKRSPGTPWMQDSVALQLSKLLDEQWPVLPKGESEWRSMQPGDVAVLCATNKNCQQVADSLHKMGLKASLSRAGLMQATEVKLVLACLKFLLQKEDALSVAELLLLSGDLPLESIITHRLDYLQASDEGAHLSEWASDRDIIGALSELRPKVVELSSNELLNQVIEALDLTRLISRWGRVQQRLANIDMLRKYSLQYEEACNRLQSAASLGGFLLYLTELERQKQDMQASGQSEDAVEVLTYHRSKGLEWPVVILMDMERSLRDQVLGISLVTERQQVDMQDILGGRWLRFWVNPYGRQHRGTRLAEQLAQTPEQQATTQQARAEEARLLYVGFTRARDYLILPSRRGNDTAWINRVWHQGQSEHPTWEPHTDDTPWIWNDQALQKQTSVVIMPPNVPGFPHIPESIERMTDRVGPSFHPPLLFDPKKEYVDTDIEINIPPPVKYREPLFDKNDPQLYTKTKALMALTLADRLTYAEAERLSLATDLLRRYEGVEEGDPKKALSVSGTFLEWIHEQWESQHIWRRFPLHLSVADRSFEATADFVIQTEAGLVLLQNDGFYGPEKKQQKQVRELAGWIHFTREALGHQLQKNVIYAGIHFVNMGTIWEVKTMKRVLF